jgi:N6-L-threonylcarbamoyladenine synthase
VLCQKAEMAGASVFFPELEFCTDNGAMIAFAGAMRLQAGTAGDHSGRTFAIKARWELETGSDA